MIPTHIVLHHSDGPPDLTFEQIREYHLSKGWDDIGYHFVISPEGVIHKGREDTVVGAHALGANQYSIGVCCIGNFSSQAPSKIQLRSLCELLTTLSQKWSIIPENIIGHCDVTCEERGFRRSACPGEQMIALFDWIRDQIRLENTHTATSD